MQGPRGVMPNVNSNKGWFPEDGNEWILWFALTVSWLVALMSGSSGMVVVLICWSAVYRKCRLVKPEMMSVE
ncbi:MAG: hypothetical protein K2Z81_23045 [Cyanobacteria bacterium]|nr:hypothetical protein [Cyanobacteriota bacterium]